MRMKKNQSFFYLYDSSAGYPIKWTGKCLIALAIFHLFFWPSINVEASTVLFQQLPDNRGGFLSAFTSDTETLTVTDNFQLDQPAQVGSITWWGGYFNLPGPDDFTVRFYADNSGQPGSVIQTYSIGSSATKIFTGGNLNGVAEVQYATNLGTPLSLQGNVQYWISIFNASGPQTWLWEDSPTKDGVQRSFTDPVNGPWEPVVNALGQPIADTAFQLQAPTPVPLPPTFFFMAYGLSSLLLLRLMKIWT
jgi:hypothetical protein